MFGSHLSISGGMHNALLEAERLHLDTVQVFTKNQQQWKCKALSDEECRAWATERDRLKFKKTVSHASYLINLASPDETLWAKSIALFEEELSRCQTLGIPYLVIHPGAHMDSGEEAGVRRVAAAIDRARANVPAGDVALCLEGTAGQGTSLGAKLEHLADIIDAVADPRRVAVCLDTAHLFAAGYDFRGKKYAGFRREVAKTIGLAKVKVLHLNDSKRELGSRVDRHEHIGRGMIGREGFKALLGDETLARVPKILETAKGKDERGREWDAVNVEVLRSLL
jgi:deoxyribonuclease-4